MSLLLANGLLMFLWWVTVGDDFHLTRKVFTNAPFGIKQLTEQQRNTLLTLLPELEKAMSKNVVFKRNAGKNVGNYNLQQCRYVTDKVDKIWLDALGMEHLWEEIELERILIVRTSYDQ